MCTLQNFMEIQAHFNHLNFFLNYYKNFIVLYCITMQLTHATIKTLQSRKHLCVLALEAILTLQFLYRHIYRIITSLMKVGFILFPGHRLKLVRLRSEESISQQY